MSKLYGQVFGTANTTASRRGHSSLKVSAQSWEGSLITVMNYTDSGELLVTLEYSDTSNSYGDVLFHGTMEELIAKLAK